MYKKWFISIAIFSTFFSNCSKNEPIKDGSYLAKLSGLPQLEVKTAKESAVYTQVNGDAISIVGDETFTTTYKLDACSLQLKRCEEGTIPPVWLRYYDGPNILAKDNFEEISFSIPVGRKYMPAIFNQQSLWDQMIIVQPAAVFSDLAPTYCGFSGPRTIWANGGFNFEFTVGNTGFDVGDAPKINPWNSPWNASFGDTLYPGWTVYPLMAFGNGAGNAPTGYAFRIPEEAEDFVQCKYTILNDKRVVILEMNYKGWTTKYAVPQKLFIDRFLPEVIASGNMAADDKQVKQITDFYWRWMLFTPTLTIQKPTNPDGKLITLDELKQYFPMNSMVKNIRIKVKGFDGFNNLKAFENTLVCKLGFEIYGSLWDDKVFTDLKDYGKWLATEADKRDPRYAHWRCIEAIARSREKKCAESGSEKNNSEAPWQVANGYLNEEYPEECDCNNPTTKAIIESLRKEP
jgi:hypothetical protein